MKKTALFCLISLNISVQAQFIQEKAPTSFELQLNQTTNISELLKMAHNAKTKKQFDKQIKIMEKAAELKPNVPFIAYQLAEAYSLNDDKTKAYNALIQLQKQGLYFDIQNNKNLANLKPFKLFNYIKENFDANGQHFGVGKKSYAIDKSFSGLLFESIAFDSNSQSFLMGSLRDGRVVKIANNGKTSTLINPSTGGKTGPWSTIDLAVDSKNDELWVASSAISQFGKINKESSGMSGIFKYQLSTGNLLKSYLLPENKRPSMINSIHLTKHGDLYMLGTLKNVVLKIAKNAEQIALVFTSKKYQALQRITVDDSGKVLYLSDNDKGLVIVNLENQEIYNIENNAGLNLTGITDLDYDDNGLIMVQGRIEPQRIMRLALGAKKLSLNNIFPIESANPKFNNLTYGVVVSGGYYYIANSQIAKTNKFGGLLQGQQWENMEVLSSAKHYKEKETLEYQETINKHKKKTGAK